jgi:hypothetical protein
VHKYHSRSILFEFHTSVGTAPEKSLPSMATPIKLCHVGLDNILKSHSLLVQKNYSLLKS